MDAQKISFAQRALVVPDNEQPAIRIPAKALRRFSQKLDVQLARLVARWSVRPKSVRPPGPGRTACGAR